MQLLQFQLAREMQQCRHCLHRKNFLQVSSILQAIDTCICKLYQFTLYQLSICCKLEMFNKVMIFNNFVARLFLHKCDKSLNLSVKILMYFLVSNDIESI